MDSYESVSKKLAEIENDLGDIYMLVNCAGQAICGTIEDFSMENAEFMMNVNFFGTYKPTKYVLRKMKAAGDGIIVLTSSQAGLLGLYGYGAYASAKFALRGFAETIAMETCHKGIYVTLALPADTDTPGFAVENESKPEITQIISGSAGLAKPEDVAKQILYDALVIVLTYFFICIIKIINMYLLSREETSFQYSDLKVGWLQHCALVWHHGEVLALRLHALLQWHRLNLLVLQYNGILGEQFVVSTS